MTEFADWLDGLEPVAGGDPDSETPRVGRSASGDACGAACCNPSFPETFLSHRYDLPTPSHQAYLDRVREWDIEGDRLYFERFPPPSPYRPMTGQEGERYRAFREQYEQDHPKEEAA